MTQQLDNDTIMKLVAVGDQLGGFQAVRAEDPSWGHVSYLRHEDGRELEIEEASGRWGIRGNTPPWELTRDVDVRWPGGGSITVSPTKSATAIAKDIERRLLPEYTEKFEQFKAAVAKAKEDRVKREQVVTELLRLLPPTASLPDNQDRSESTIYGGSGSPFYQIRVDSDGTSVRFEHFSASIEDARLILAAVGPMPWKPSEAAALRAQAEAVFTKHSHDAEDTSELSLDNCAGCALAGRGEHTGFRGTVWPNRQGWGRLFVQAGRTIPLKYQDAFQTQIRSADNVAYGKALARDIATWGVTLEEKETQA